MKSADIIESIASHIENKIIKEWKHEGYIDGMQTDNVFFVLDGKTYCVRLIDFGNEASQEVEFKEVEDDK